MLYRYRETEVLAMFSVDTTSSTGDSNPDRAKRERIDARFAERPPMADPRHGCVDWFEYSVVEEAGAGTGIGRSPAKHAAPIRRPSRNGRA